MKFEQIAILIGVVGKKGHGQLDNGQDWATDRVELHVQTPFPDSDQNAFGSTVTVYQVADHDKNLGRAKACLNQEIILNMEMVPAKKLGQAPKFVCLDFGVVREPVTRTTGAPASVTKSAS